MIYNNAVEQIKGMKPIINVGFRLAKVSSLSNGRAYVQFYGESTASGKLYPYIEGYKPTVGDDVLLVEQGSTYIIIGKISKTNIVNNFYLRKTDADTYYLTQATADTLYMSKNASLETNRLHDVKSGIGYNITLDGYNLTGATTDYSIGTSSRKFKNIYGQTIYGTLRGAWKSDASSGTIYSLEWSSGSTIRPSTTNAVYLGTSSYKLKEVHAVQFYQNGTAISTSDRRKKTNIKDIAKKYIDFFKRLKPRSFRFKDGESGRTHTGFIAQEVEEAAAESGINNKDLAFICIDEEGNYGLRYEELIAIQTQVIQDLMARVERLENIVKERA